MPLESTPVPTVESGPLPNHKYEPVLSLVERCAYSAAHRIMTEPINNNELVLDGARRTFTVDAIARIIVEEMSK